MMRFGNGRRGGKKRQYEGSGFCARKQRTQGGGKYTTTLAFQNFYGRKKGLAGGEIGDGKGGKKGEEGDGPKVCFETLRITQF